ncbi:MAG: TadE/TadG family type IV pilus assembly protein [Streptosporangiaceae bacterium]
MSSIEFALLTPIMLITLLLVVQFAMYFHARHVALAAAQEGARVARTDRGPSWRDDAKQRTVRYLDFVGERLLVAPTIRPYENGTSRGVRVSGDAVSVLPFLTLRVVEGSFGPIECFRSDVVGAGCQ